MVKCIGFWGLRRSGNHAVIEWLQKNMDNCLHVNDCVYFSFEKFIRDVKFSNVEKIETIIFSFEDQNLYNLEEKYSQFLNKTSFVVYRDFLNWLASSYKMFGYDHINKNLSLWKYYVDYGQCYKINFNKWIDCKDYKEQVLSDMDIEMKCDNDYKMARFGSSFENRITKGGLLQRWKNFTEDENFIEICQKNKDLIQYSLDVVWYNDEMYNFFSSL